MIGYDRSPYQSEVVSETTTRPYEIQIWRFTSQFPESMHHVHSDRKFIVASSIMECCHHICSLGPVHCVPTFIYWDANELSGVEFWL